MDFKFVFWSIDFISDINTSEHTYIFI